MIEKTYFDKLELYVNNSLSLKSFKAIDDVANKTGQMLAALLGRPQVKIYKIQFHSNIIS